MNSRQLHYAVLLSQHRSFSQVAGILNITQPALSKQILTLEEELGVKLFDRSSTPLSLTPAGEHFVREAKDILYREEQLKRSMEDFHSDYRSRLTVGISPLRSLYYIPRIICRLKEEFPGLQIVLKEANSTRLKQGVRDGSFDFAIMHLPVDELQMDTVPLKPEPLVLAVPNKLLALMEGSLDGPVSLSQCQRLPFVTVSPQQELRQLFDRLCIHAGVHPKISVEVVSVATAWAMARSGLGATLLPLGFMEDSHYREGITIFPLQHTATTRQPAVVTRKGQFLSRFARRAIELLADNSTPPDAL